MGIILGTWVAQRVGSALRNVECEKCGTSYQYEIVRRGEGKVARVLWIDSDGARESAAKVAYEDAIQRAHTDHDPVPCPSCRHVQSAAIRSLAIARIQPFAIAGIGIILLSVIIPIVLCFKLPKPNKPPRFEHAELVVGGTGVSFGVFLLGLCWLSVRRFDRARFDALPKNHRYRLAPPALMEIEPNTFGPAAPISLQRFDEWMLIQPHRIGLPPNCLNCGAICGSMFRPPIALSPDQTTFPCCKKCQPKLSLKWWIVSGMVAGITLSVVILILRIPWPMERGLILGLGILIGLPSLLVLSILIPNVVGLPLKRRSVFAARGWAIVRSKSKAYQQLLEKRYGDSSAYVVVLK